MNEEVINDLYSNAVSKGYKKSREEFVSLLQSNDDVMNDMYSYVQSKGYKKGVDEFKGLIGATIESPMAIKPTADEQKKNRSSVSPFVDGGLEPTSIKPTTEFKPLDGPFKPGEGIKYTEQDFDSKLQKQKVSAPMSYSNIFAKTIADLPSDIGESWAVASAFIERQLGKAGVPGANPNLTARDLHSYNLSNDWRKYTDEVFPTNQEDRSTFLGGVVSGLGQAVPMVMSGGISAVSKSKAAMDIAKTALNTGTKLTPFINMGKDIAKQAASPSGLIGGSQMSSAMYRQAIDSGATEDQAQQYAIENFFVGTVAESLPIQSMFSRILKKEPTANILRILKEGGVGAGEEFTTEMWQTTYENWSAQRIYDFNRDMLDGVGEAGAVGGTVGFILNTALAALVGRRAKVKNEEEGKILDKSIEEVQSKINTVNKNNEDISTVAEELSSIEPIVLNYGDSKYLFAKDKSGRMELADEPMLEDQAKSMSNMLGKVYKGLEFSIEEVISNDPYAPVKYNVIAKEKINEQQDAIQKQTAGQVPVQPGTGNRQEMAQGEPQAEPQGITQEGQEKVRPAISEMAGESVTVRIGNRNVSGIVEVDEGGKSTITEGSVTYEIPSDSDFSEFSRPVNITKDGDFVVNGDSFNEARIVLEDGKKKALLVRQDGTTKAVTNPRVVEEIEYNIALASLEEMNDTDADNLINQYEQQRKTERPTEGTIDKTDSESDEDRKLREAFEEIDLIEELALMELEDVESQAKLVEHTPKTMKEAKTYLVKKNPDGTYQATLNGRGVARKEVLDDLGKLFEQRTSEDISKLQEQTNKLKQEVEEKLFGKEKAKAESQVVDLGEPLSIVVNPINTELKDKKIEGKLFNEQEARGYQELIDSKSSEVIDPKKMFGQGNESINQNLFNYDNPIAEKNVNGVNVRITEGLIEGDPGASNRRKTYLLYADGKVAGKFYSVSDAKKVVNFIEANLVKSPAQEQLAKPLTTKQKPAPKPPRPISKKKNREEIISRPAFTPRTLARQWLLSGGKLLSKQSEENKRRGVGVGKGVREETGMSGVEMRTLFRTIDNKRGVSIEMAAGKIWEGLSPEIQASMDDMDIRNAMIEILMSENKKTWIDNQDRETSEDQTSGIDEYIYSQLTDQERADFDEYQQRESYNNYLNENAKQLAKEYDAYIKSQTYQDYIEEIYGRDREGQDNAENQNDGRGQEKGSDGGTDSVQEKELPQVEVEFNEDEVNLLSNLLDKSEAEGKDLPEVFQLETTTDNEARKQALVESATKLMETVSDDLSSKSSQTNAPTMEPTPIVITENTELTNKVPRFPLVDLIKKRINLVMADQLKVGDGFMGGPLFPLIDGIFGKAAWASINLDAARKIVRGAINGDYSVVFNMNPTAVDSNTAFMDTFIKKLNEAGIKENVLVELKSYVKDKKFGKKTDQIRKITEESTTIDEFSEKLSELDVDTISDFVKKIIPSKSVVAETAIGKILQAQNITQEDIRGEISEQLAKDLPMGAMTMVLKITDANGNPVTEKNIDDAIITPEQQKAEGMPSHRNYPFYVRGSAVGILDSTVPFWNMSKAAMSTINAKVAKVIRNSEGKAYSASQARAAAMRSASMKASKSFITQPPTKSAYQQFIERLSKAIPSVEMVTSQKEFDDLLTNLNAKSLATKNQKIYGAVLDGKLYLNPSLENFNTPIHEFAHVWTNTIKELSPEIYQKGVDLIKGSDYVAQIEGSKDYKRITDKMRKDGATDQEIRDYILEEALATAIGDKGESFATASQQRNFKNWLNDLFQFIKKLTGISKLTPKQIQDLNLDDFLNSVVVDLLSEKPIFKNAEVKNLSNQLQLMARPGLKADDIVKIGLANGFSKGSIRELLKRRGFTQGEIDIALGKTTPTAKKAPSAKRIVGQEKDVVTITVDLAKERDRIIKEQIKLAKEVTGDLNEKRAALAENINPLIKRGIITATQARTIINRISKVNLNNPITVDRLLTYIDKVFDNANYAADMADLRKLQRQARTKKHTSMKDFVDRFTSINPELILLDRIQDYKEALDFLNNLTPSYARMNEMLADIESYEVSEKFDSVKTIDDIREKYKEINLNKLGSVEEYVALIKDINSIKRKLYQLLENEAISPEEYDIQITIIGEDQSKVEKKYAVQISKIKKGLISEIKNQRPNTNTEFTKEENGLIKEYLELSDADLESLSPEDLFVLNDLLENISNGEIDYYRFKNVVSKATNNKAGVEVGEQLKGSKLSLGSTELRKRMAQFESSFWEGLLGLGRATSGPLQKFIISPFNRAIGSYEKFLRDGYNDFLKLKKKYGIKDNQMNKIGMLTTYLQEYMAQFDPKNKGVKDIGKRDWFKQILSSDMIDDYSPEELKIIEQIHKSLPKDKDGNVNPKEVYDSYIANDGKFFTKNEKDFFDSILEWKKQNSTGKQKAANEMSGNAFKEIPFHMLRSRYSGQTSQITPTTSGENGMVRIKAGTGKERVSEAVGAINTNFEKLFIKGLEQTGRDYFLSKTLKDINNVLSSAKKELAGDKGPLIKAISYTLSDALAYEFSDTASQNILKRLVQARAAMTLFDPIRAGVEFTSTLLSFGLRARTLSGYKNLFGSHGDMKNLLEFTDSPLRLRQNINNAIDINDGRIEPQGMLMKWTTFLSGLPERTMMVTSWMPTFTSEFQRITGEKFDMKKFNDSEAYREKYGKAIKESSASADAQTEKIIGPTTKAGQRREILIFPGKTVGRDTVSGQILGFFSNYPYREATEFVNGFKEAGEVLKKGDSAEAISQLQKPLGIALNVAAYGFLSSVVYASRLILLGDDDEEERGSKLLEELMTAKGFIEETAANGAALAASKYAGGGRAMLQVLGTLGMMLAKDEETKATIKKMLKGSVYVDPLPTQKLTGYGTADKVNTAILKYIPQFVVLSNIIIDSIGVGNELKAIYDKVESKGIEALTEDEELRVLALSVVFTGTQLLLNYRGTSLPSYNNLKAGMKAVKEETGVSDIAAGKVPAKKKSSGGGGGRAKAINKSDLKRYFPEQYNELYGEGSATYEIEQEIKAFEKEQRELKNRIKDQVYGGKD
jgi:hypothetical protein